MDLFDSVIYGFVSGLSDKLRGMIKMVKQDKSLDLSVDLLYNYYIG